MLNNPVMPYILLRQELLSVIHAAELYSANDSEFKYVMQKYKKTQEEIMKQIEAEIAETIKMAENGMIGSGAALPCRRQQAAIQSTRIQAEAGVRELIYNLRNGGYGDTPTSWQKFYVL